MILKNIQLPKVILAGLYKHSIVDLEGNTRKKINQTEDVRYLGGNGKHILLLINNKEADYLTNNDLNFLLEVLTACRLSLEDIAIVNLDKYAVSKASEIPIILEAEIIILSGIELSILELPFNIPLFQPQLHNHKKYVCIPLLNEIKNDNMLKNKLWALLKVLFSI